MRFQRFDLNLLVSLDALLTHRNVTRAAEQLHIGQSAASAALARLREHFDDDLLVRSGREMRLTALGETLVGPVRSTLRQAQSTLEQRPGFDPATSARTFTLLASDYVMRVLMIDVVRKIAELAPDVRFVLTRLRESSADLLDRGQVDLMIVPENFGSTEHPSEELFSDEYVCIGWNKHPVLHQAPSLDDYLDWPHVAVRLRNSRPYAFEDAILPAGERRVDVFVEDFINLPALIVGTPRLATVQKRLAEHARESGLDIAIWPLPFQMPPLLEYMRWHKSSEHDPGLEWLRGVLKEALGKRLAKSL